MLRKRGCLGKTGQMRWVFYHSIGGNTPFHTVYALFRTESTLVGGPCFPIVCNGSHGWPQHS